jgi:hypothetical protein
MEFDNNLVFANLIKNDIVVKERGVSFMINIWGIFDQLSSTQIGGFLDNYVMVILST